MTGSWLTKLHKLRKKAGFPKDTDRRCNVHEEEELMTPMFLLSYDQPCCMHQSFVESYAVQAFSIASDCDPNLMPKEKNQITIRKVSTVIQSLLLRRPNPHSSYGKDHEKHTFLTLQRRQNLVYDITNVKQHDLFEIDESCSLLDLSPKRANPLAVVEGVKSRFFYPSAPAGANRHICQASFDSPVSKGKCIPSESSGERELRVVQEVRV